MDNERQLLEQVVTAIFSNAEHFKKIINNRKLSFDPRNGQLTIYKNYNPSFTNGRKILNAQITALFTPNNVSATARSLNDRDTNHVLSVLNTDIRPLAKAIMSRSSRGHLQDN